PGTRPPSARPATSPRRRKERAAPAHRPRGAAAPPAKAISCPLAFLSSTLEQLCELFRRNRLAVQEPLHLVAAVALEEVQLRVGLDALGDHLQVQRVAERDD